VSVTHLERQLLLAADQPVRSETVAYETGARALTLVTTSAELGLQLYSAYLGDEQLLEAVVAEVIDTPRPGGARLNSRRIEVPPDFLLYHRDRALADHLERFLEVALDSGIELSWAQPNESVGRMVPAA
jgi:hypothetical protein